MELRNEIIFELSEISPYLASLQRTHPFVVPESYFQEMEDAIVKAVRSGQVKAIHEGILNKKEHPFKIPLDYFEDLPANTLLTIQSEEEKSSYLKPSVGRKKSIAKALLAAASVALITALFFILKDSNKISQSETASQINSPAVNEQTTFDLLGNASEIDEALVVELLVAQRLEGNMEDVNSDPALQEDDPSLIDVIDLDPELLEEI